MSENALSSNTPTLHKKGMILILPTMALSVFAILGNAFHLPLFFSVDLIFGSIVAFIALRNFGFASAVIVGLIGAAYTITLWGHSYAFIIFSAEIITVGLLRKYISNLVYADIIFWIGLGAPLIWIFYSYYLGTDENSTNLIILKQPLNGVFNAICASLFLNLGAIYAPLNKARRSKVSAKKLTTNILLLLTLISGALPIVLDSYRAIESREAVLEELMENYSLMFFENPETGQLNRYISLPKADQFFKSQAPILKGINLAFVDQDNNVIYQQGEIKNIKSNGKVISTNGKMKIWQPDEKIAGMLLWAKGEYFLKQTVILDDQLSYMIISQSAQPIVDFIKEQRLQTMVSLLVLLIGALVASHILSNILVGPIQRLDRASTKFRDKIGSKQHFTFPESGVSEYENLANSLNSMAEHIKDAIIREEFLRNNIDEKIAERTNELKRLSIVANQSKSAVTITDFIGKIEWVNNSFKILTGYDFSDAIGQEQKELLSGPSTDKTMNTRMENALANGEMFNGDFLYYRKNGKLFWAEVNISPIHDEHHQVTGYIIIQNDATDRISEYESLNQKKIAAEEANAAKSEILTTMSHEIRTPLNSILGLTELIADSGINQSQMNDLKMIQHSGHNLLGIVNDVLDMVNIETGEVKVENTSFSLNNLLSTCISGTNSLAHEKGLRFHLKESGTCPRTLVGDPLKLRQILWNLASHAVKSTSHGSIIISLDCSTHQFDEKVKEKRQTVLHLSVSCSSINESENTRQKPSTSFSMIDRHKDRDRFKGAGPSISVVTGLVELMKGSISITKELEKGVTYEVYLPFDKTSDKEAEEIENKTKEFIGGIGIGNDILVAEDNPTNAMIARAFLEKNGQNVRIAENGMQAMTEVRKKRPDLIFLDIYMPEMNGMEVAEKLRRTAENSVIPIIGLTAEAFTERHEEFIKSGMNDVITKPFTETQLRQVMVKYLTHKMSPNVGEAPELQETKLADKSNIKLEISSIGDENLMKDTIESLGIETFTPILKAASKDVRTKLDMLEQAAATNNYKQIKETAHSLLGISSSLFATKLQKLAQEIEKSANHKDLSDKQLNSLKETIEETIIWWNSFVAK